MSESLSLVVLGRDLGASITVSAVSSASSLENASVVITLSVTSVKFVSSWRYESLVTMVFFELGMNVLCPLVAKSSN